MIVGKGSATSNAFDERIAATTGDDRERTLAGWETAPAAREAHPREELPNPTDDRVWRRPRRARRARVR
jgi:hypothetical protein